MAIEMTAACRAAIEESFRAALAAVLADEDPSRVVGSVIIRDGAGNLLLTLPLTVGHLVRGERMEVVVSYRRELSAEIVLD